MVRVGLGWEGVLKGGGLQGVLVIDKFMAYLVQNVKNRGG